MIRNKITEPICIVAVIISLLITVIFTNADSFHITASSHNVGYETRLFDTGKVHSIDIVMDDWDTFLRTCPNEEYTNCTVIIDGKAYKNVGIRGKGNTSLSTVSSMNSERYSFKIEFDHYDSNQNYYGLDKLCLNNIIQDNTYMKDYLTYQLMQNFQVDAPLCSYAYIRVNNEDWGLYLAVEGVEDSFLTRNYGQNSGNLYKPDSMNFGGGRGNGMNFNMNHFSQQSESVNNISGNFTAENTIPGSPPDADSGRVDFPDSPPGADNGRMDFSDSPPGAGNGRMDFPGSLEGSDSTLPAGSAENRGSGSINSDDVKLKYIDGNPESYTNIFNNAKTDITDKDKERLISSLKSLNSYENLGEVINIDEVLRYFVVHNYVCNGDSYTGSMIHNYYLYEENGKLSMIPWDYNLAFGTFQSNDATSQVNSPIDTPVSGSMDDRPMVNWIFQEEEYTTLYHEYFAEFLETFNITEIIEQTEELISTYVEKDPTKFCTYEEFKAGAETLKSFCNFRTESIRGQLNGTIPSTSSGQAEDSSSLIDASSIQLSDMGTMDTGNKQKKSYEPSISSGNM